MDSFTITVILQMVNFILIIGWLVMTILGLIGLRKKELDNSSKMLWVILILFVPIFGSLAFFVLNPQNVRQNDGSNHQTNPFHS